MLWAVPFLRDVYGLGLTRAASHASAVAWALLVSAPLTGYLSDRVLRRRKLPYAALSIGSVILWLVFSPTTGALPLRRVALLLFRMGAVGRSVGLTGP